MGMCYGTSAKNFCSVDGQEKIRERIEQNITVVDDAQNNFQALLYW
jgi:hypothetical protein